MTEDIERWLHGGTELLHVVPVIARQPGGRGGFVTTCSIEIWEDGIRVHFVETVQTFADENQWEAWIVDDGAGTEFRNVGSTGGSGPGSRFYTHAAFEPGPSSHATQLRIANSVIGIDITVDLPARSS